MPSVPVSLGRRKRGRSQSCVSAKLGPRAWQMPYSRIEGYSCIDRGFADRTIEHARAAQWRGLAMGRRFFTLDVFTDRRFTGNPLAVVLDPAGLDDAAMQ